MYSYWTSKWEQAIEQTNKGRRLHEIKTRIEHWPWAYISNRRLETALARLRVGHVGVRQHLFRFQLSDTPNCECGEVETVDHLLLFCQNSQEARASLAAGICREIGNKPLTVKLLLGGEQLTVGKQ